MHDLLLAARLILALVFVAAGLTKLADLPGSRRAMAGFGIPDSLAGAAGTILPLIELAIAVALIPTRTAWLAAVLASALLLLFVAAMAVNLLRGRTPDCHCFGRLHSERIGVRSILRNVAFLLPAALLSVEGRTNAGSSAVTWITNLTIDQQIGVIVTALVIVVLAVQWWFMLHLLRQNGRFLVRLEALESEQPAAAAETAQPIAAPAYGLPIGTPAPPFSLPGLHGETLTLAALTAQGKPTLLVFASPKCGPCAALMPDIAAWQREARDKLTIALISEGDPESNRNKAAEHSLSNILLQERREVADAYKVNGTPTAVVVGTDGTVSRAAAAGGPAIRTLVAEVLDVPAVAAAPQPASFRPAAPPAPAPQPAPAPSVVGAGPHSPSVGDAAPDFNLPDLGGRQVSLASLRGSDTLLLFWNTGCGFCRKMLDDLKVWEEQRPGDAPKIVVFSSGPIDDVRALGLTSTVIPDPDFSYGPRFGANGTPMAVLLDAQNRVASSVAAGAPAVLALAGGGPPVENNRLVPLQDQAPARKSNGHRTLGIGDEAPTIELPDLSGRTVKLSDFLGHSTLLLFWNTGCGFCKKMLPDLKAWEAESGSDAPRLLLVSSGVQEEMRATGLRAPVLIDEAFATGPVYGANGTPMGLLIDERGMIASEVAAGADAVLALARSIPARA